MNAVGDTHLRLDGDAGWKTVASDSLYALMALQRLFRAYPSGLNPDRAAQVAFATRSLPCYDRVTLLRLTCPGPRGEELQVFAFIGADFARYVSGTPEDIYSVNLRAPPQFKTTPGEKIDPRAFYLRLFHEIARGDEGWRPVESLDDISWSREPSEKEIYNVGSVMQDIKVENPDPQGRAVARLLVQRKGALFLRRAALWNDGIVQMLEETKALECDAFARPASMPSFRRLRGTAAAMKADPGADDVAIHLDGTRDFGDLGGETSVPSTEKENQPVSEPLREFADLYL